MSKEVKEIKGIVRRVGPLNGAGVVNIQFMLENDKRLYVAFVGYYIGLIKVGDEVCFNLNKTFKVLRAHDVDDESFSNLTLNREQAL